MLRHLQKIPLNLKLGAGATAALLLMSTIGHTMHRNRKPSKALAAPPTWASEPGLVL